ncbi:MAG: TolC family protein [Bacteroidales bacterium]|jgi:outer membrane protein TolC|nr:TolC family protein [Bacteroidales bacterium]NPV36486.1 TolC family protein [Bacteroidales bacterium]
MNKIFKFYLLILTLVSGFNLFGQNTNEQNEPTFDPIIDDIAKHIPPLEALIDSAIANSPYLKFRDAAIVVSHYKYLNDKNQLLRDIGFSIEWRYGRFDNWSSNEGGGTIPVVVGSTRDEWRYGAGAYIKIPLFDITNRKTTINLAKKEVEQAINHRNELIHEIRKDVIVQYNELLMRQKLMKIASDNQITAEIQLRMAEKQFQNGQLPLGEMARMMDLMARAKAEYEQQKTAFVVAYSLLEITTGVKFNLLNKLQ